MKKFVSGLIVGVLLFASASVFADSTSLIGQKVQGLFTVEKGGVKVADAVIINGSAYAPVRAVAEASGVNLTVEGKNIIMGENTTTEAPAASVTDLQVPRSDLQRKITQLKNEAAAITDINIPMHERLAKELANNGSLGKEHQQSVDGYKARLTVIEKEIATLQAQLDVIDAQ